MGQSTLEPGRTEDLPESVCGWGWRPLLGASTSVQLLLWRPSGRGVGARGWGCEAGRPGAHSFLLSLGRALGAVIALLLCGQLCAADTGSEATDHAGRCLGSGGSLTSQHCRAPCDPADRHPLFGKSQFLHLVLMSGVSFQWRTLGSRDRAGMAFPLASI